MAMIDYGALLRVDGKLVNRNGDLFMEASDTGYICEKALHPDGNEYDIDGEYYVYAGDEHFLIVFYKGMYKIISHNKVIRSEWSMEFRSIIHHLDGLPDVKISRLSPDFEIEKCKSMGTWEDYVKEHWIGATGKEKLSQLQDGGKHYKLFEKRLKKNRRKKGFKTRPFRFLAEWEYDRRKYEVIFGYGIDPDEEVWNDIKNEAYGFRPDEIEIIDSWFAGE